MRNIIPAPIIAIVSDLVSDCESHATLDSLFMHAEAPGDPPEGSKHAKAQEWLRRANKNDEVNPLDVLGLIIEKYMDEETSDENNSWNNEKKQKIDRLKRALQKSNLQYRRGGKVTHGFSIPSTSLEDHIKSKNIESINYEFERAVTNIQNNPKESLSAACNILESVFKVFIEQEGLDMPKKKDLRSVWPLVRDNLNLDPSKLEDRDLKEILAGLANIINGIGSLRTHASTAHGAGIKTYRIEPRHARLAVSSAHTIVLFVLEVWDKKNAL